MKRQCDKCERPATHHSVEIIKGEKIEKHLCELHAAEEGMGVKAVHTPLGDLLTNFVKSHSGGGGGGGAEAVTPLEALACPTCGLTFGEFREAHLLGCPDCYKALEEPLEPLLVRNHENNSHHVGKVPRRAGAGEGRQVQLSRMRKRLDEAVESEDYELAARLRDDIGSLEEGES